MIILQRIGGSAGEAKGCVKVEPTILDFSLHAISKQSRMVLVKTCCATAAVGVALEAAVGT